MKVLSIDPGYERLGIAIIEKNEGEKKERLLYSNCLQTDKKLPFCDRLFIIGKEIERLIVEFNPEVLAIETLFFNTNQTTAMKVAETRGTIIYLAVKNKMEVHEYTPLQIKIAISGYGRGDKTQVTMMVKKLIQIERPIKHDDEYDAIAVGLTFFASYKHTALIKKK